MSLSLRRSQSYSYLEGPSLKAFTTYLQIIKTQDHLARDILRNVEMSSFLCQFVHRFDKVEHSGMPPSTLRFRQGRVTPCRPQKR